MAKPITTQQRNRDEIQYRQFHFDKRSIDEENRTVELSFSSEETVVPRWWGNEVLGHEEGECDLTRLSEMGVLLFAHGRDPIRGLLPIGSVQKAWIDAIAKKGRAVVKFDEDPESDLIFQKVRSGTLKSVSCGYRVYEWLDIEPGHSNRGFVGPTSIAVKWEPIEISIEPVPADINVGVGRTLPGEQDNDERAEENSDEEGSQMTEEEKRRLEEEQRRAAEEAARTAREAEQQRTLSITEMCRSFEMDPADFIRNGTSLEEAQRTILARLAEQRKPVPTANTQMGQDEKDKFRAAAIDGLCMRAGLTVEKPSPGATELRGATLLELARECLERATGEKVRIYDKMELARAATTGSSDFPLLLSNVANKSLMDAYQAAPTTFQEWTKKGSLSDFKIATRINLSEADELLPISELGEYKHAQITEAGETVQLGTYGRRWTLSRQMIINDDLNGLTDLPAKYGASARRMINRMVYAILTSNPNLSDNVALFHATHKNLATAAAALSVESLGRARAAMKKHTNIKGKEKLNISPAFLLVPTDLETAAEQLISSIVDPSANNATPNPFANKLKVISDAELDTSETHWFLAAAPGMVNTVEVSYLNGQEQPYVEFRNGFEVDGVEYKIRLDVGVKALDYRGLYKNPGA